MNFNRKNQNFRFGKRQEGGLASMISWKRNVWVLCCIAARISIVSTLLRWLKSHSKARTFLMRLHNGWKSIFQALKLFCYVIGKLIDFLMRKIKKNRWEAWGNPENFWQIGIKGIHWAVNLNPSGRISARERNSGRFSNTKWAIEAPLHNVKEQSLVLLRGEFHKILTNINKRFH